jgi:hypothetical protein
LPNAIRNRTKGRPIRRLIDEQRWLANDPAARFLKRAEGKKSPYRKAKPRRR